MTRSEESKVYRMRCLERGVCPNHARPVIPGLKRCSICREYAKQLRAKNPRQTTFYYRRLRDEIIAAYGGPVCACCGETEYAFLSLDHIGGGGIAHRKRVGSSGGMYAEIKRLGFPKGYRVLCMNCNHAWGRLGYCPHSLQEHNGQTTLEGSSGNVTPAKTGS